MKIFPYMNDCSPETIFLGKTANYKGNNNRSQIITEIQNTQYTCLKKLHLCKKEWNLDNNKIANI